MFQTPSRVYHQMWLHRGEGKVVQNKSSATLLFSPACLSSGGEAIREQTRKKYLLSELMTRTVTGDGTTVFGDGF